MRLRYTAFCFLAYCCSGIIGCAPHRLKFEEDAVSPIVSKDNRSRIFNVGVPEYLILVDEIFPKSPGTLSNFHISSEKDGGAESINVWINQGFFEIISKRNGNLRVIENAKNGRVESVTIAHFDEFLFTVDTSGRILSEADRIRSHSK